MNTLQEILELKDFDETFPYPEHERMSKCDCANEEEHALHFEWRQNPRRSCG